MAAAQSAWARTVQRHTNRGAVGRAQIIYYPDPRPRTPAVQKREKAELATSQHGANSSCPTGTSSATASASSSAWVRTVQKHLAARGGPTAPSRRLSTSPPRMMRPPSKWTYKPPPDADRYLAALKQDNIFKTPLRLSALAAALATVGFAGATTALR